MYTNLMRQTRFEELKAAYPGRRLLIVSNTAGATSYDRNLAMAAELEEGTGLTVLPHSSKKPGCGTEIMEYFRQHPETGVSHPSQVAIVGDRLSTDIMMANMMGSWGFWVKDGVVPNKEKSMVSCWPKLHCNCSSLNHSTVLPTRKKASRFTASEGLPNPRSVESIRIKKARSASFV
ncbi:hypothetical protein D7B24_007418 [Verticillium nonalfalfae]|uniref:Phosphatidylglycerophosphatase gep4 mitochondrial n=1 Tax=Verticillium nonalfalfae TaxID=1051616 RepID=A0A3M9YJW3_9PEZI|nr:uncharacterized protein D7B24_007418 [Verticillium nonalfalfae]RNJ60495.1 hypothetical protein D7B24_007418 [Verticillium nonalfalfae]